MEITIQYIISQIFTIFSYMLIASTYYMQRRKTVLMLNFLGKVSFAIAYVLLEAWSALAMTVVGLIRNVIFIIDEKKNGKRNNINKIDIIVLVVMYAISIISAIFTYQGFFSLLPVIATMIYTYSVCQKNIKTYKLLGIPSELCWTCYNFYIKSIFAIILETIPLTSSIIGYIREVKKDKKKGHNFEKDNKSKHEKKFKSNRKI